MEHRCISNGFGFVWFGLLNLTWKWHSKWLVSYKYTSWQVTRISMLCSLFLFVLTSKHQIILGLRSPQSIRFKIDNCLLCLLFFLIFTIECNAMFTKPINGNTKRRKKKKNTVNMNLFFDFIFDFGPEHIIRITVFYART